MPTRLLPLLLLLALMACTKPADTSVAATPASVESAPAAAAEPEALSGNAAIAEFAIPQFHMALNDARFDDIYKGAAPELKSRKTQQEFVAQVSNVHRQLGAITGSARQSWHSEEQFPSTLVTLTFKSSYTAGEAVEEFVFRVQDQTAKLAGYSIQSSALTPK